MIHGGYRHLPVVDGDDVVGVISIRDLVQVVVEDSAPRVRERHRRVHAPSSGAPVARGHRHVGHRAFGEGSFIVCSGRIARRDEYFALLREAIDASGGREFKNTGDGLFVAFTSASAACRVRC